MNTVHPLLETIGLGVSLGGVHALDDVSLQVDRGEVVGLIGPNGAGKTATIDALTGFVRSRGRILFEGGDISGWSPDRRARSGLVRTWQSLALFDDLTIEENCRVASEAPSLRASLRDLVHPGTTPPADEVGWALAVLGLEGSATRHPSEVSLGERKLAGVARALAARPSLVLLDEPAAGLDTDESRALGTALRALVDEGITLLLVDHDMGLVLSICDRLYVLDFGQVIAAGDPAAVRRDPRVIEAYLGRTAQEAR